MSVTSSTNHIVISHTASAAFSITLSILLLSKFTRSPSLVLITFNFIFLVQFK
ncbi:hypothetical protein HOB94_00545 [bacterium]|nr:hypothetical protein [bacterium]MBT4632509.1 hypothetical protein [bacterium]